LLKRSETFSEYNAKKPVLKFLSANKKS